MPGARSAWMQNQSCHILFFPTSKPYRALPWLSNQALARRVRDGLAAATVLQEDAAEAASAAATAAAERLVSGAAAGAGAEAVTPELALAMLRRAGRTGSAHAARAFQVGPRRRVSCRMVGRHTF